MCVFWINTDMCCMLSLTVLMFLTYLFFLILDKRFCKLLRTAAIWPGTKCSDRSNRIGSTEWKNGIFIL